MKEESDFKKVTIIGVGLIGGSMGLALNADKADFKIVGVDKEEVIEKALSRGAIDEGTVNLEEGVREAEVVIMATPIRTILELLPKIAPLLKRGCLVTDTGSTKVKIIETASQELPPTVHFIGGHPMAGSEKYGIEAADPHLFRDKNYILTPTSETDWTALEKMSSLIQKIKANLIVLNPFEHDRLVGATSHLPQIVAVSLVNTVDRLIQEENNNHYWRVIGGGFKDMTRISLSSPEIWLDICATNQEAILKTIRKFKEEVNLIEEGLINDPDSLKEKFQRAKKLRESI